MTFDNLAFCSIDLVRMLIKKQISSYSHLLTVFQPLYLGGAYKSYGSSTGLKIVILTIFWALTKANENLLSYFILWAFGSEGMLQKGTCNEGAEVQPPAAPVWFCPSVPQCPLVKDARPALGRRRPRGVETGAGRGFLAHMASLSLSSARAPRWLAGGTVYRSATDWLKQ